MSYSTTTTEVTIAVRDSYPIKSFGQDTVYAELSKLSPEMLSRILEEGAKRVLNDGTGAKDKTDDEKAAGIRKRLDAWMAGDWAVRDREPSIAVAMLDCVRAEVAAAFPDSDAKAIDAALRKQVTAVHGEKAKLTFDNWATAKATKAAKQKDETRSKDDIVAALVAKYEPQAREVIAARNAASKVELDLGVLDI